MYISRAIENKLQYWSEYFPVVMVCGARQVRKTTLLEEMRRHRPEMSFVTLDEKINWFRLDVSDTEQNIRLCM